MLQLTTDKAAGLLTARWDGPGIEEDFTHDDRAMQRQTLVDDCWHWLVDFRQHGDASEYNARDFYQTMLPDTAWRASQERPLRVAVLLGPGFDVLRAGLPDADYQQRRRFAAQTFTDEGEARSWLESAAG